MCHAEDEEEVEEEVGDGVLGEGVVGDGDFHCVWDLLWRLRYSPGME